MKPEWCPQEFWELATNLEMDVAVNHGGEFPAPILAKALLDAHQRGRREGMEEAAALLRDHATISNGEALDPAVPEILAFISAKGQ